MVVTRRVFKIIPIPDGVLKLVNDWGIQSKKDNRKNYLEFLKYHWKKFDWENEELDNDENIKEFQ